MISELERTVPPSAEAGLWIRERLKNTPYQSWNSSDKFERIARWVNVLRVLEALTPEQVETHFSMEDWLQYEPECGTIGCAAGHCGLDPWFRARGFEMAIIYKRPYVETEGYYDVAFSQGASNPDYFFGNEGVTRVFMRTSATYKETLYRTRKYLIDLINGDTRDEE